MPLAIFLLFLKKLRSKKAIWLIIIYCIVSIIGDTFIKSDWSPRNITKYYNIFLTLFEFLIFSIFIHLNIQNKKARKILVVVAIGFVVFLVLYFLTVKYKRIDSVPIGVETLIILVFSFYMLFELINSSKSVLLYNDYRFWIILGMVSYLGGSFFIYIFADQLPLDEIKKYWFLTDVFYIIKNIFFTIGLLVYVRQPKEVEDKKSTVPFLDII